MDTVSSTSSDAPSATPPGPLLPTPSPAEAMPSPQWNFLAAFCAWLLPGLGHFILGQSVRAVILGTTIGTLWLCGLLIGGLSVVDHDDHPAWFLGQMLLAPSFAADRYRVRLVDQHVDDDGQPLSFDPEDEPPFEPAYGRAQEQGTLFTSLAGLLNLLAIIDVLYRDPRDARDAPAGGG